MIVEDDLTFSTMIKSWLGRNGFEIETAANIAKACKSVDEKKYDLILSDMRLPDGEGLDLLDHLGRKAIATPLIIMTGYADVQNAVNAMKHGAVDYVSKPVQPEVLLDKINTAIAAKASAPTASRRSSAEAGNYIEGESEAARRLFDLVALVAPTSMSVLITGNNGTGKEYVAHRIHDLSKRSSGPFVAIDCGAMLKELSASEFFGHIKGAFTGAVTDKTGAFVEASTGTLFLDEIGNLSYDVQVQLLRAIQEHKVRPVGAVKEVQVDVRLICATNRDLMQAVAKGEFREDLYHRINEFNLAMPELKDRGKDIIIFANHFLSQANEELERNISGFDDGAVRALLSYRWPGNLRQLKNVIKRATLLARGNLITKEDLGQEVCLSATAPLALHDSNAEKERILNALKISGNNKAHAAKMLGIDRKTLYNKLKLYGI